MIGQSEIIVRAQIEDTFAAGDSNVRVLRRSDNALGLVKTLRLDFIERFREMLIKCREHPAI
jgi:hypothetical protein